MSRTRVIPTLLLSGEGLVKTEKFGHRKYVGDPVNAIRIFNEKEVDELIVVDIDARKRNHPPNFAMIERFASECFMPVAYGGGITSIDHAATIISSGIEKVCLQSAVFENRSLLGGISKQFGAQSIVVSLDFKKDWLKRYRLYDYATGRFRNDEWQRLIPELVDLGIGELLINCVDKDGTRTGMDKTLIHLVRQVSTVPIIALGGACSLEDMASAVEAGADAVSAGAFFVYHGRHNAVLISYPSSGEIRRAFKHG